MTAWCRRILQNVLAFLQDATLTHYMEYTAESLIPVMAHIAKNVVKVNEGLTKHMVSAPKAGFSSQFSIDCTFIQL